MNQAAQCSSAPLSALAHINDLHGMPAVGGQELGTAGGQEVFETVHCWAARLVSAREGTLLESSAQGLRSGFQLLFSILLASAFPKLGSRFGGMKSGRGANTRLMSRTKRSTKMRVGVTSTELAP
jgi:hypothetical protein